MFLKKVSYAHRICILKYNEHTDCLHYVLQCRWVQLTRGWECSTPPSGDGDTSARPASTSSSPTSAVRRWASSGDKQACQAHCFSHSFSQARFNCWQEFIVLVMSWFAFFFPFRAVNVSATCAPDNGGDQDFFCVKDSELTYGKKIKTALYPW